LIWINGSALFGISLPTAGKERRMRAIDVMTNQVLTATPQTTVQDAAKLMINNRVSGLPIVDGNGQLVGIVTEGDLLRRAESGTERRHSRWSKWFSPNSRLAGEYIKSHARRVADVMSRDVISVTKLASLGEIADLMEARRIKRVPVAHNGKLVGIVSRADLLRVLASGGVNSSEDDRDGSIRSRLLADLRKQRWTNCSESDVVVSDGVVHFWGIVGSEEERRALRVAAENTPGVRGVEDHTISGPLRPGPLFPIV
jgi:CBS domain-containing protein